MFYFTSTGEPYMPQRHQSIGIEKSLRAIEDFLVLCIHCAFVCKYEFYKLCEDRRKIGLCVPESPVIGTIRVQVAVPPHIRFGMAHPCLRYCCM